MRQPWDEVRRTYQKENLQMVQWFKEFEDHVAVELEFMTYLCLKMNESITKGEINTVKRLLIVQKVFLINHLAAWIQKLEQVFTSG